MSSYEERNLLKQLESASKGMKLPPHVNRLKRKLIVRQVGVILLTVYDLRAVPVMHTWVKVFRINPEFRISRLTFYRKSASKC